MSFIYTSNSPEFLNYVASCKTRNDIINDPRLCVLLEDPHIKDNMELALLYNAAEYGDYEAKREFVGFFLANGPELDTDTLMFFREKIINSPIYMEVYRAERFYDLTIIDDLRINTYGKDTTNSSDNANCLENPCEYLGPFSSSIGLLGDDKNFNTLSNVFARITSSGSKKEGSDKDISKTENEGNETTTWGNIRQHVISKIIPDVEKSYRTLMANMSGSFADFSKKLKDNGLEKETNTVGDKQAEQMAKDISSAVKVNVVSNLGDCSRIWEQMRRLRIYDPSKNTKGPINTTISNKSVDGTPKKNYSSLDDTVLKPSRPTSTVGGEGKTLVKKTN
jgi:hypothetical protein